jgi:hypothetical protein
MKLTASSAETFVQSCTKKSPFAITTPTTMLKSSSARHARRQSAYRSPLHSVSVRRSAAWPQQEEEAPTGAVGDMPVERGRGRCGEAP